MNQTEALQESYKEYLARNPLVNIALEISSNNPSRVDLATFALNRLRADAPEILADADRREGAKC